MKERREAKSVGGKRDYGIKGMILERRSFLRMGCLFRIIILQEVVHPFILPKHFASSMRMSMLVGYTPGYGPPFPRANRVPVNFYLEGAKRGLKMDRLAVDNWTEAKKFSPRGCSYGTVFDLTFIYTVSGTMFEYYDNNSGVRMTWLQPRPKNRGIPDYFLIDGAFDFHNWTITLEC